MLTLQEHTRAHHDERMRSAVERHHWQRLVAARRAERRAEQAECRARAYAREAATQSALARSSLW